MNGMTFADGPAVILPNSHTREVRAAANGITYRVSLWLPCSAPPPGGWPVVYVLDAATSFATFVEIILRSSRRPDATGIVPTAVVGIAPAGGDPYAPELRRRDYTPAEPGGGRGADAFLAFIVDELAPSLIAEFPLNRARQILFGHSLTGFFTLYALGTRPDAFFSHVAISPSIWWDPAGLRARLSLIADAAARVFIAVGEWEGEVPPWRRSSAGYEELVQRRAERRMVDNARIIAADLTALLGKDRVSFRLFPEEDHASVLPTAAVRALRFALAFDPRTIDHRMIPQRRLSCMRGTPPCHALALETPTSVAEEPHP